MIEELMVKTPTEHRGQRMDPHLTKTPVGAEQSLKYLYRAYNNEWPGEYMPDLRGVEYTVRETAPQDFREQLRMATFNRKEQDFDVSRTPYTPKIMYQHASGAVDWQGEHYTRRDITHGRVGGPSHARVSVIEGMSRDVAVWHAMQDTEVLGKAMRAFGLVLEPPVRIPRNCTPQPCVKGGPIVLQPEGVQVLCRVAYMLAWCSKWGTAPDVLLWESAHGHLTRKQRDGMLERLAEEFPDMQIIVTV